MKTFNKTCKECNTPFIGTGPAARFCSPCAEVKRKEAAKRGYDNYVIKHNIIEKRGVGSGGNQGRGKEHHSYVSGIGYFQDTRKRIKEERRYCERCKQDLLEANRWQWCLHHRDHDRTNNEDSNFELLCKKCHQVEHDCHLAFSKTCND